MEESKGDKIMETLAIMCIVLNLIAILSVVFFSVCLLICLKDEKSKDKQLIKTKNENEGFYAKKLKLFLDSKEIEFKNKKVKVVSVVCFGGDYLITIEDNSSLGFTKQVSLDEIKIK